MNSYSVRHLLEIGNGTDSRHNVIYASCAGLDAHEEMATCLRVADQ